MNDLPSSTQVNVMLATVATSLTRFYAFYNAPELLDGAVALTRRCVAGFVHARVVAIFRMEGSKASKMSKTMVSLFLVWKRTRREKPWLLGVVAISRMDTKQDELGDGS